MKHLRTRTFLLLAATFILGISTAQIWKVTTVHAQDNKGVASEQRLLQLEAEVVDLKARVVRLEARLEDQAKPRTRITPLTQR